MGDDTEQRFTIHGSVFRDKPGSVKATRFLHSVLPVSSQRSIRDRAFRSIADGGVAVVAGVSAACRPRLAARFLAIGRQREDHRYGKHPRQVIEVVHPAARGDRNPTAKSDERPKLVVFAHGGAWGSGSTWMYRLVVDRLSRSRLGSSFTVASIGYRVYPDADTNGQVNDLASAMRWISRNWGAMGFDHDPEVYLMGHSSGAHISLLYLIRQAEEKEEREAELSYRHRSPGIPAGAGADSIASRGGEIGDRDRGGDDDGDTLGQLEVEGFIGLGGVYDVYRHYIYERWRGVHEISPMKAANGGVLRALSDYSHPRLLQGVLHPRERPWPRTPRASPPAPAPAPARQQQAQAEGQARPAYGEKTVISRADQNRAAPGAADGSADRDTRSLRRALGRRLPRSLLVHGTADATVPFAQTAAVAGALRMLGVPTIVRYDTGGDHFGMVGQVMFEEESLVETAISHFASQEAKDFARKSRGEIDVNRSQHPPHRHDHQSRL